MLLFPVFLRSTNRNKDGKDHRYFSLVENRRVPGGRTVQRTVLYLGEINDQQQAAWRKTLEVFDEQEQRYTALSLFPDDREIPLDAVDSVQVTNVPLQTDYGSPGYTGYMRQVHVQVSNVSQNAPTWSLTAPALILPSSTFMGGLTASRMFAGKPWSVNRPARRGSFRFMFSQKGAE